MWETPSRDANLWGRTGVLTGTTAGITIAKLSTLLYAYFT
jgi:hypothetical protein